MRTVISYSTQLAEGALERLKLWFDPAMEGTPYEIAPARKRPSSRQGGLILRKKMFLKF